MLSKRQMRNILLPVLVTGLGLRALIPAGYMPGSFEGGPWFVLCEESLPMLMATAPEDPGHHHHHAEGSAAPSMSGDCSFGHLLAGAALTADIEQATVERFADRPMGAVAKGVISSLRLLNPSTRAPPPASFQSIRIT